MSKNSEQGIFSKLAIVLFVAVFLFFFATVAAYLLGVNADSLVSAKNSIEKIHVVLTLLRLCVVGGVWYFWESICRKVFNDSVIDDERKREVLLGQRNTLLWGFLAIELLVVQDVLGYLIGVLV